MIEFVRAVFFMWRGNGMTQFYIYILKEKWNRIEKAFSVDRKGFFTWEDFIYFLLVGMCLQGYLIFFRCFDMNLDVGRDVALQRLSKPLI